MQNVIEIELSKLVTDKKNPRTDYEEIEELADSLQKNGQLQPLSVEDLKNGQYLIMNGHRRKQAYEIIAKRTKKTPLVKCIVEGKMTDDERLIKRAAIDAQTKNLSVPERDELWIKIWKSGKLSEADFAKTLGIPQAQVRHFLDRQNLSPEIKKLNINAGILQETIMLPEKHRTQVLKYAAKTGIGAMGLRQQVKELKGASDTLVKSFTSEEIDIDSVKQLKTLNEDKQKLAIANIVANKKQIAKIPKLVKDTKMKAKTEQDQKKITAQVFVNKLNDEVSKTGTQIRLIKAVIEEMDEKDIHKYLPNNMKEGLAETLSSLIEDIEGALDHLKKTEKRWNTKR